MTDSPYSEVSPEVSPHTGFISHAAHMARFLESCKNHDSKQVWTVFKRSDHLTEAINFRTLDRSFWQQ